MLMKALKILNHDNDHTRYQMIPLSCLPNACSCNKALIFWYAGLFLHQFKSVPWIRRAVHQYLQKSFFTLPIYAKMHRITNSFFGGKIWLTLITFFQSENPLYKECVTTVQNPMLETTDVPSGDDVKDVKEFNWKETKTIVYSVLHTDIKCIWYQGYL